MSIDQSGVADVAAMQGLGLDPAKAAIMKRYEDRSLASSTTLELTADRRRAQFSSWYELFARVAPGMAVTGRSAMSAPLAVPGAHGF